MMTDLTNCKNALLQSLSDPEKLVQVATTLQTKLKVPSIYHLMDPKYVYDEDSQLLESIEKSPEAVRGPLAPFIPIRNSGGVKYSGFATISLALAGT